MGIIIPMKLECTGRRRANEPLFIHDPCIYNSSIEMKGSIDPDGMINLEPQDGDDYWEVDIKDMRYINIASGKVYIVRCPRCRDDDKAELDKHYS